MKDLPIKDFVVESKSLTVNGSVAGSLPSRLPQKKATEKSHKKKGGLAKW